MTAATELKKLNKQIQQIGAMFSCSCCDDTLESSPPEHILNTVREYLVLKFAEETQLNSLKS